jgi:hypothetical protein
MTTPIILKNMEPTKAVKLLAKTMHKEMLKNGFATKDIINFTNELLNQVILSNASSENIPYSKSA